MSSARMRRVDEMVREVVAAAISTELKDPRIGFVTVTSVKTSPDLHTAQVFVSVLGDEEARESTLKGLQRAHGILQSRVAREVRMKRTPILTFVYDDTIEKGVRISQLIDENPPSEEEPADE